MSEKDKDEIADSIQEYLEKNHGADYTRHMNPTAADREAYKKAELAAQQKAAEEKEANAQTRGAIGAVTGAMVANKNVIPRVLKKVFSPAPELVSGTSVTPTSSVPGMRVEPTMGSGAAVPGNAPESTVTRVMQSISPNEGGFGTGRQREDAQHLKSNRNSILLEEARKNPNFVPAVIEGGEMYPSRGGILLSQSEAEIMAAEEAARNQRIAEINAQAERDAALRAQRAAENAAEAQAKAARRAEMLNKGINFGKGAFKVGAGALGGYFTGRDVIDIAPTVFKKGIHLDQYTPEEKDKLLNTAGGLSMMIPTLPTQLLGAAMIGKGHQDELSSALDRLMPKRKTK
jgi:hypothetical protein